MSRPGTGHAARGDYACTKRVGDRRCGLPAKWVRGRVRCVVHQKKDGAR